MVGADKVKDRNVNLVVLGGFFLVLSGIFVHFFLPFYLKERGLNILEIGGLLTLGMALGILFVGIVFSRVQSKISLKAGLNVSAFFGVLRSFVLFVIPSSFGVLLSNVFFSITNPVSFISNDVALQHNVRKGKEVSVKSKDFIFDLVGNVLGLLLAVFLIYEFGFKVAFLIFALLGLPSFFFYSLVSDRARFKPKFGSLKFPPMKGALKLLIFSEVIYWLALSSSFALIITFLVVDTIGRSFEWIAYLFCVLYISMALTTILLKKRIERSDPFKISIIGMLLLGVSAILIVISQNLYVVLFAMVLEGVGGGIWIPAKTALQWKITRPEVRERVSGYLYGWRGFASAVGPLFGGLLVTWFGIVGPFYFKAIISFGVLFAYWALMARK